MKRLFIQIITGIIVSGAFHFNGLSENLIRQKQLEGGLQYDYVTDHDSGSSMSQLPVVPGGVSYELFSRGSAWDNNLYFLDRKVVGFYLPRAEIRLFSEDTTNWWLGGSGIQSTRADRPFSLAIRVWGLTPDDPEAPAAAKQVLYTHTGKNYDQTYTPNGNTDYTIASFLMGNANPMLTPVYTQLTPMAPTKSMGLERFTVSTLVDETVKESSIIADKMLIVWPVSEASIEGVTPGMQIRDSLPKILTSYRDLYPISLTYMQIYKGAESLGTVGTLIPTSLRWHNTIVPQNEIISLENWEELIPDDGTYTIEVLSITPFDSWRPERLAKVSFSVNRKLNLNGQVITSEY